MRKVGFLYIILLFLLTSQVSGCERDTIKCDIYGVIIPDIISVSDLVLVIDTGRVTNPSIRVDTIWGWDGSACAVMHTTWDKCNYGRFIESIDTTVIDDVPMPTGVGSTGQELGLSIYGVVWIDSYPKQPLRMKIDSISIQSECYHSYGRDTLCISQHKIISTDTTYYLTPEQLELLGGVE